MDLGGLGKWEGPGGNLERGKYSQNVMYGKNIFSEKIGSNKKKILSL